MEDDKNDIVIPDFGNFDIPDLDLDNFDLDLDAEADTANRYIKPRLVPMKERQIMFEHAAALANEIDRMGAGMYKGENTAQAERHAILTDGQKPRHKKNTEPNKENTENGE